MGNYIVRTTFFLILIAFFCGDLIHPQENPSQSDKFLVGSLLANTQNSQRWQTQYSNYDQVMECGLNTVWQTAIKHFQSGNVNQPSNLASLALFPYIYAANDSGTGANTAAMNAQWWNVDWVSYFTQAKYRNWEAELDSLFVNNHIGVIRQSGEEYTDLDGTKGYKTKSSTQINDTIIKGPNYWQYPRYTFTNVGWNATPIEYKVVFWMKIDETCIDSLEVCKIMATNTDSNGVETVLHLPSQSGIRTVYANELSTTQYTGIAIEYDYQGLFSDLPEDQDYPPLPGDPEITRSPGYNPGSKVQFKVQWLGNRHLYIDRIEVYDKKIYEHYFIDYQNELIDSIVTYDNKFKTGNPLFYSRLKYYNTIDEPHSLDCYEPIRKLQEILDENTNVQADLLTHWYPGWGGSREGDATWPYYEELMQPHQVNF